MLVHNSNFIKYMEKNSSYYDVNSPYLTDGNIRGFQGKPVLETNHCIKKIFNNQILKQIHIRENGVIFELEIFNISESLSSFLYTKVHLQCVYDFINFLDETENKNEITKKEKSIKIFDEEVFEIFDELLEKNKEYLFFMRGNILTTSCDFQTKYLCFNFIFLKWITPEANVLNEQLITFLININFFEDFNEFVDYMKRIQISPEKSVPFQMNFLSYLGFVSLESQLKFNFVSEKNLFFHSIISKDKSFDSKLIKQDNEVVRDDNIRFHSELMKIYYKKPKSE